MKEPVGWLYYAACAVVAVWVVGSIWAWAGPWFGVPAALATIYVFWFAFYQLYDTKWRVLAWRKHVANAARIRRHKPTTSEEAE